MQQAGAVLSETPVLVTIRKAGSRITVSSHRSNASNKNRVNDNFLLGKSSSIGQLLGLLPFCVGISSLLKTQKILVLACCFSAGFLPKTRVGLKN